MSGIHDITTMEYREKSAWACLISILLAFGPYLWFGYLHPESGPALVVAGVIIQVALLVGFHTLNAVASKRIRETGEVPPRDEMERHIELGASRWFAYTLATVVVIWCVVATLAVLFHFGTGQAQIAVRPVMAAIHLLFSGFIVANGVYYAVTLIGYRRLSRG